VDGPGVARFIRNLAFGDRGREEDQARRHAQDAPGYTMPDKVDVAEVARGQVSVNDHVINIETGKALLLMLQKCQEPQDAVIDPPADDDLMTVTDDFPIYPDELPNASDN
jgi:hypothetical protein